MPDKTPDNPKSNKKPPKKNSKKNNLATSSKWITNSVALLNVYMQLNNQSAGWNSVYMENGTTISYAEHEDDVILWAQTEGVNKSLCESRGLSAAYRKIQRLAYREMVVSTMGLLTRHPQKENTFDDLSDQIGLSLNERLVLLWWMSDRKQALIDLANGNPHNGTQPPMPIFYSPKGRSGKSYIIHKLIEPLGELSAVKTVSDIEDDFGHTEFSKLLVANFDELSGMDKTDIRKFKQWYYATQYRKRKIHSQQIEIINKITAGIGSSNVPFSDLVPDTTGGARRFFDIQAPTDGRLITIAREFDFTNLWQSIQPGIEPSEAEISLIDGVQEEQRRKHIIELWFDELGRDELKQCRNPDGYPAKELYNSFHVWSKENNEETLSCTMFGRKIKSLIHEAELVQTSRKYRFYKLR